MAFLTAGGSTAEDVRVAVDVVFGGVRGAVCFFFREVGAGVFEARDGWEVVLGV